MLWLDAQLNTTKAHTLVQMHHRSTLHVTALSTAGAVSVRTTRLQASMQYIT